MVSIWLGVVSGRSGATPGQPTITDTMGLTWDLVDSQGFNTVASPTYKLWVFHAHVVTSPATTHNTITITYPQTQTTCAWQVIETEDTDASVWARQTKTESGNSGGTSGITATFASAPLSTSGTLMFVAAETYAHSLGIDQLLGTQDTGLVLHEQSTS